MKTLRSLPLLLALFVGLPTAALAQSGGGSAAAVTTSLKGLHDITVRHILNTAEMLDADMYAYRPTDEVRSTGQLLAHIAGAQFTFCSVAAGEENPLQENFEETATTKPEIIEALEAGFEYCADVYGSMTDESGAEVKNIFGMQMAGSAILAFNSAHNYEHYGNLVTYMRLNGIVPPSSM